VEDTAKSSKEHNDSNVPDPARIRQQFVPAESEASGPGANWTALAPAPDRKGAYWVRAHVGVGDTFPVKEKDGQLVFEVALPEGSDEKLLVEVRYQGGIQRIDVPRDTAVTVEIGSSKYEWYYPSLYVGPDGEATTNKAFLILTRLP
jgi:hypothetical protein